MLVWINGPFGGGKTQTAYEIRRRLAGSVVCDPEHVGAGLHRMMPARLRTDFQDLPAWRQGVFEVLDLVLGKHDGDVIVPMTITQRAYLRQIPGALRDKGYQVRHYALLADRATVLRRLRGRTLPLQHDRFAEANPDRLTVCQVAERIAASAGLTLAPDTGGALRARARRTWVTVRHIRLGRLFR